MSEAGMAAFFCTHECNDVCLTLGLLPFDKSKKTKRQAQAKGSTAPVDKLMTCSCPLCGAILEVLHSAFIKAHTSGRDVYCTDCTTKVAKRQTRTCSVCEEKLVVAPFWYLMKGMKEPTSCKKCKAMAQRMATVKDGSAKSSSDGFSIIEKP